MDIEAEILEGFVYDRETVDVYYRIERRRVRILRMYSRDRERQIDGTLLGFKVEKHAVAAINALKREGNG